jgi:hypothetical protein
MNAALVFAAAPAPRPPSPVMVVLLLAAITIALAVAYSISVRRHPYRPCRKCGESGKHRGTVFTSSFRACGRCGGTGRELRPFARTPEPRS